MNGIAVAIDKLNKFVNRLLLIRDPVPLDEYKFSFHGFPRMDGAEVDIWIRHALSLQVRVVHAHVGTNVHTTLSDQPFVSAYVTRIPVRVSDTIRIGYADTYFLRKHRYGNTVRII